MNLAIRQLSHASQPDGSCHRRVGEILCYTDCVFSCFRVLVTEVCMANLTISVDEEALKRARIRALEENSSVNAVLARPDRECRSTWTSTAGRSL